MNNNIIIRSASKQNDLEQIKHLLKVVFGNEGVDTLAEILHTSFPYWKPEYWFLAEDTASKKIVSGFCLIPWQWNFKGRALKVAEMGLVATLPQYRGKGLMKLLNAAFNTYMSKNGYNLAAIQGIPGFYQKFGYHYALPMEHHVMMPLSPQFTFSDNFEFYEVAEIDINFLLQQDSLFSDNFDISVSRSRENWEYLLVDSKKTEYGSEFWIIKDKANNEKFYFRIALHGFGSGLVVSEVSENINIEAQQSLLSFVNKLAAKREKPFLRFNLSHESSMTKQLLNWGASKGKSYAWQIKIPNIASIIETMQAIFEERIAKSYLMHFTGNFHLNFYTHGIDMVWDNGKLLKVNTCKPKECGNMLSISSDLFVPLCLGHKTWEELQAIRPDVFPGDLYFDPTVNRIANVSRELTDILFPKTKSWINCQY